MTDRLITFLNDCSPKWRTRNIQSRPDYIEQLNLIYPGVSLDIQIYCLLSNSSPFCVVCNNPIKSRGNKTCSISCRSISTDHVSRVEKQKITLQQKYGTDNIRNIAGSEEKRAATMIEKYGSKVSDLTRKKAKDRAGELTRKGRETLKEKYNITNPAQLPDHHEKCKNTLLTNYGVDNYFHSAEFLLKSSKEKLEKWSLFVPHNITMLSITSPTDDKKDTFINPNQIIKFICNTCETTDELPTETVKWRINHTGTCCFQCGGMNKGSNLENEIRTFIQSLGLITVDNSRSIIKNREIDIFIPEKKVGVEFHGLYWHNDLRINKKYHSEKLTLATEQGIKLIQIFEDEWVHNSSIVKSRLANILGHGNAKVAARKCVVKEIDFQIEKKFQIENHIQGYAKSSKKLGLFFNGELVSVMTFSKPNLSKGQKSGPDFWELLRFANKSNLLVIGGASKLFSYFIKNYKPSKVLTFADKRWSAGDLYKILGFDFVSDTTENYWYINNRETKRIHRFSMRKNKNDNPLLTEYENRLSQGYLRIWDCGSSKWIWSDV